MPEPIDSYIRRLESILADAEWMGCDSPLIATALEAALAERERGEAYHVAF